MKAGIIPAQPVKSHGPVRDNGAVHQSTRLLAVPDVGSFASFVKDIGVQRVQKGVMLSKKGYSHSIDQELVP